MSKIEGYGVYQNSYMGGTTQSKSAREDGEAGEKRAGTVKRQGEKVIGRDEKELQQHGLYRC